MISITQVSLYFFEEGILYISNMDLFKSYALIACYTMPQFHSLKHKKQNVEYFTTYSILIMNKIFLYLILY